MPDVPGSTGASSGPARKATDISARARSVNSCGTDTEPTGRMSVVACTGALESSSSVTADRGPSNDSFSRSPVPIDLR